MYSHHVHTCLLEILVALPGFFLFSKLFGERLEEDLYFLKFTSLGRFMAFAIMIQECFIKAIVCYTNKVSTLKIDKESSQEVD